MRRLLSALLLCGLVALVALWAASMPAPTNISYETATVISNLPYSTTQDVNDAGVTKTVFYKLNLARSQMVGFWFFGDLATYKPRVTLVVDAGSANHPVAINVPGQFWAVANTDYWFQVVSDTGDVSPAILTVAIEAFTEPASFPAGSIIINDEAYDPLVPHPAVVISGVDGSVLGFVAPVVSGESGDALADGTFAFEDLSGATDDIVRVKIYTPSMHVVATVAPSHPQGSWEQTFIGSDGAETFFLGWNGASPAYRTMSKTGVLGTLVSTLAGSDLTGLAGSPDGTILYYAAFNGGTKSVRRWDIPGASQLSDLVVNLATYEPKDIIVMADGTVVVEWSKNGGQTTQVRSYASDGTLLHTFDHSAETWSTVRLARGEDDNTFLYWEKKPPGDPDRGDWRITELDPVSGATIATLTGENVFSRGTEAKAASLTPPRFGTPESCPLVVLRAPLLVTPTLPEPGSQIDNSVPCCADCSCADGTTPTGVTGPVPPPISGIWYRRCVGGGEVPSAADVVEPEDWHDEFPPKEPDSWLTIVGQAGSPENEADERWGLKPLSDRGRFVAGRLEEVGSIERRSSDKNGNYAPARMRVVALDDDGTFRERLGDPDRRELIHREARYEVSSYAARKVGLDPIPRMQGRIVDIQPPIDRKAMVEIQDVVGSQFGTLDPQKTIGLPVGSEHPSLPEASKGRIYNILLGEKSDAGAPGATGESVSVGMMPVVDCGDQFLPGETPDPEGRLFNDSLTQVDDAADVNLTGTGGTITYPTRVFVAPIIGGEIGPFSNVPTGFLDDNGDGLGGPSIPHAHRKIWMDIAGGADEYLTVFTKVPGFHPQTNPTVDLNARYQIVSGTPSMPAFPPRNGGVGPQWDFFVDYLDDTNGAQWGVLSISAPLNLNYTITGTPGTTRYVYAVSALGTLGESPRSAVLVVEDGPAILNGTDNIVLTWDPPADNADAVIAYRIRGRQTNPPTTYLRITEIGVSPIPLTYTDDGTDVEKAFNVSSGDALVSENVWAWIACALGDVDVHQVYGSDGTEGDTPKRRLIGWDEGTIMGPDSIGWSEPERYRVVGGIRQSGFYARGLPLKHHRSGAVTFAWNGCGWKDPDGLLVDQVFRALLLFLNEVVEKNDGEGYRDGDFGPIETFADGTPKFWTSKFEAAQQQTIDWLTSESPQGLGYVGTIVVTEPTALAEVIRRFFTDYGGHLTASHRGQIYPYLPNPAPEAGAGRIYRERMEIARLVDHRWAKDERENRVTYSYDYNYDTQTFRNNNIPTQDDDSIRDAGGERIGIFETPPKPCYYANDQTTIEDRWARHLTLYAYSPRYVDWATNLKSLADYNGDPARFSHRKEGLGLNGEAGTAGVIMHTSEHYAPGGPREVIQTAMLFRTITAPFDEDETQLVADDDGELLIADDDGELLIADGD